MTTQGRSLDTIVGLDQMIKMKGGTGNVNDAQNKGSLKIISNLCITFQLKRIKIT